MKQFIFLILVLFIHLLSSDISLLAQQTSRINSFDWNNDGSYIALGDDDGNLTILNADYQVIVSKNVANAIDGVDWNPLTNHIAISRRNQNVQIWSFDNSSLKLVRDIPNSLYEQSYVTQVLWNTDGSYLATIGENDSDLTGQMIIWDVETASPVHIHQSDGVITDASWNPVQPDEMVFSEVWSHFGNRLTMYNVDTGVVWEVDDANGTHLYNSWNSDGTFIASVEFFSIDRHSVLKIRNSLDGTLFTQYQGTQQNLFFDVTWGTQPNLLLLDQVFGFEIWDVLTQQVIQTTDLEYDGSILKWNPSSLNITHIGEDGKVTESEVNIPDSILTEEARTLEP